MNDLEQTNLKYTPTGKELAAGIDQFQKLGGVPLMDTLAAGNVLNYNAVMEMDWNTIYAKLLYDKWARDYNKRLSLLNNPTKKPGMFYENS